MTDIIDARCLFLDRRRATIHERNAQASRIAQAVVSHHCSRMDDAPVSGVKLDAHIARLERIIAGRNKLERLYPIDGGAA